MTSTTTHSIPKTISIAQGEKLDVERLQRGRVYRIWYSILHDTFDAPIRLPILVARGTKPGKVLGITAAVHGDELNGIPVIQKLFNEIDLAQLSGTVVGVIATNVSALHAHRRRFADGTDLNHVMPGIANGNTPQVFAYRFFHHIVKQFDYLLDLHTASRGRTNSYYIRADMNDPTTARLAELQNAQIIVHNPPNDGTLRGAASLNGIAAITLEVGNPSTFQKGMIRSGLTGMHNALIWLGMTSGEIDAPEEPHVLCQSSYWLYTSTGGILTVRPQLTERVTKGQLLAQQHNIFGDLVEEYYAPEDGIVIGRSINPVNRTGGRILHLGVPATP